MRNLVIALLALNILYFIWTFVFGGSSYVVPQRTEEGVPILEILRVNNADSYKSKNSKLQSSCYTLGPFNSEKTALNIANRINNIGLATEIDKRKTMQTLNFLVYLQALSSRKAAEEVVQEIRKHEIKNYKIINSGPYKNAIALGSFASLDKARRHSEYVRFLGYDAKYTEQKIQKEVFWVNYDEPFGSNVPVMQWTQQVDVDASVQKIPRVCEL